MSTTIYLVGGHCHQVSEHVEEVEERVRAAQATHQTEVTFTLVGCGPVHVEPSQIEYLRTERD
jgi:hypothetical protein